MQNSSVVSLLRERAGLQPDDLAFTYTDYDQDWAGVSESLSWAQVYRRTLNVAHEVRRHGSVGDRAVIAAPQGVAYMAAFLGAMEAGLIAVPLTVPYAGSHDERVAAVLADTAPTVVLTTSGVIDTVAATVAAYVKRPDTATAPAIIDVDSLDLDDPNAPFLKNVPFPVHALGPVRMKYAFSPKLHHWLKANYERFDGIAHLHRRIDSLQPRQ